MTVDLEGQVHNLRLQDVSFADDLTSCPPRVPHQLAEPVPINGQPGRKQSGGDVPNVFSVLAYRAPQVRQFVPLTTRPTNLRLT